MRKPFELSMSASVYRLFLATWVALVIGGVVLFGSHVVTPDTEVQQAVAAQKAHDDDIARQLSEAKDGVITALEAENEQLRERVADLEEQVAALSDSPTR